MKAHTREGGSWSRSLSMLLCRVISPQSNLDPVTQATTTVLTMTVSSAVLKKAKECVLHFKINLQLVLFHSICRTLNSSWEGWRAVHLLFVSWVGCGGGCNSTDFCAHTALSFLYFGFFLHSVSQPCPHYPFSSSIMVPALFNFFSPGTKFRKSRLTPGPGLMTASSYCTN